jgi:hypothetical protein
MGLALASIAGLLYATAFSKTTPLAKLSLGERSRSSGASVLLGNLDGV